MITNTGNEKCENPRYVWFELQQFFGQSINHEIIKTIHAGVEPELEHEYRSKGGFPPVRNNGKVVYMPPDSLIMCISTEMQKFVEWYNSDRSMNLALLLARLHWGFVKIHPFLNGNGRTARLLMFLEIKNHGYNDDQLGRFVEYIEQNKIQYRQALDDNVFSYRGFDQPSQAWINFIQAALDYAIAKD